MKAFAKLLNNKTKRKKKLFILKNLTGKKENIEENLRRLDF